MNKISAKYFDENMRCPNCRNKLIPSNEYSFVSCGCHNSSIVKSASTLYQFSYGKLGYEYLIRVYYNKYCFGVNKFRCGNLASFRILNSKSQDKIFSLEFIPDFMIGDASQIENEIEKLLMLNIFK